MNTWDAVADEAAIQKAIEGLKANGINAQVVNTGVEARAKLFEILPKGAEVMNMTSVTLETIGVVKEILESGKYNSVRNKLNQMDRAKAGLEMQKLGAAPDWAVGSVHAVTQDGTVVIASN